MKSSPSIIEMAVHVIMSTPIFDSATDQYVTVYYVTDKPGPRSLLGNLLRYKKFPPPNPDCFEPVPCRYYFYQPTCNELYTAATFGDLVALLCSMGYEVDSRLAKSISSQDPSCALVIRRN